MSPRARVLDELLRELRVRADIENEVPVNFQIPPTNGLFHEYWETHVSDVKELETILTVLLFHQLVETNGQQLWITEAGRTFLQFLEQQGLWPLMPSAGGG